MVLKLQKYKNYRQPLLKMQTPTPHPANPIPFKQA